MTRRVSLHGRDWTHCDHRSAWQKERASADFPRPEHWSVSFILWLLIAIVAACAWSILA